HVQVVGELVAYPFADSFLGEFLPLPEEASLAVTYDYRLGADDRTLELTITLENDGLSTAEITLPALLSNHGDEAAPFSPGGGLGGMAGRGSLPYLGTVGLDTSYAVFSDLQGLAGLFSYAAVDLVISDPFELEPGASKTVQLWYAVSTDGVSGLSEAREALFGPGEAGSLSTVTGSVVLPTVDARLGDLTARSWIVTRFGDDVISLDPVRPDGTYSIALVPGAYDIEAWVAGVGVTDVASVTVLADTSIELDLIAPLFATIIATATDQDGTAIPAQVGLLRQGETPSPVAPDNVRFGHDFGRDITERMFLTPGGWAAIVPPGTYRAVASRGYSYELDEETFDIVGGETKTLAFELEKVVDTTGWAAGDFHIHATWSPDSNVSYDIRVRQAAANDVSLPVASEHVYVGNYGPTVDRLELGAWVTAVEGQEVTTFEYGHFNAFPFVFDALLPGWGAVFEHGVEGVGLFDAMRAQSANDVVIQINHPRGGGFGAYLSTVDFDRETGEVGEPERWSQDWDMIEVFNEECSRDGSNGETLLDWFSMNNLGFGKALSSGSDSHSVRTPIGHPRSWVQIEHTEVRADPGAIVAPLLARKSFVSCGPFVRFETTGGAGMGEVAMADADGEVGFSVIVEAPSWISVETVNLIRNGEVIQTYAVEPPTADAIRPSLRFDKVLVDTPIDDAWYVVEVQGSGTLEPVKFDDAPYAMTNPIEVDADRDGAWTPPGLPGAAQ
ncbi:MAG: hypothetical protein ACI9MR_000796, partial [Myxococcota bacterium]